MGGLEAYKPAMAMAGLQCYSAGVNLITRDTLVHGLSPRVLVVYRQIVATLIMAPITFISRRKNCDCSSLGLKGFAWLFAASLIGVTANQNVYFEGLYLSSSAVASAMTNMLPAITFIMAVITGCEKVNIRSLRSIAKILGTVFCVSGAISISLFKGPKLINAEFIPPKSVIIVMPGVDNWLLGCLLLLAGACFWSLWLILLVQISKICPDHLYTTAWMCFLASLQSAVVALFTEKSADAWTSHSLLEIAACLYAGIGSAIAFFVQTWCTSKRGPLFCATFHPLCTVAVTIGAGLFLHEAIYTGSLIGTFAVIVGLYIVLWGKAKDMEEKRQEAEPKLPNDQAATVQVTLDKKSSNTDLEEPLLPSI